MLVGPKSFVATRSGLACRVDITIEESFRCQARVSGAARGEFPDSVDSRSGGPHERLLLWSRGEGGWFTLLKSRGRQSVVFVPGK